MNRLKLHSIALFLLCLITPTVFADLFRTPYVGIEVIQTNQNYKNNYGNPVYKKNPQDYGIYAGLKFSHYFGLEAGYEFQPKLDKTTTITAGQSVPGGPVLTGTAFDAVNSSIKGEHPYLGLFAELDNKCSSWFCCLKWQALVGASFSHIKATTQVTAVNGVPQNLPLVTYSKSKVVAMALLGVTGYFTPHLGLRLFVDYHNFNQFSIPGNIAPFTTKLKDTWGVGLGLTYGFWKIV